MAKTESQFPAPDSLYAILRLTRPHGLRGEIGAYYLAPDVLDLKELVLGRAFWLRRQSEVCGRLSVLALRPHQNLYLLTLENISDRTGADGLKGAELCLERHELPPLPEGWFWEADLIGLAVEDARMGPVGIASGLQNLGGQWSLTVRKSDGGVVAIPWAKSLIQSVDRTEGKIVTDLPLDYPGLDVAH